MASLILAIKSQEAAEIKEPSGAPHEAVRNLINHLSALASGSAKGTIYSRSSSADPVRASGTITLVSVPAADTVTIGGVVFTASASPSGENQFSQAGTDTADAAALVAKINAHSTLSAVVSASNVAGVVTVTAIQRGVGGNFITLSRTGTAMTLSGTALTGGAGGATDAEAIYRFGE